MNAAVVTPSPTPRWMLVLLGLALAYVLGMRVWFHVAVSPMGDEAYYWMWGQHLAWSYFDHPPLQAWLLALVATLFGWSNVSVRLLTWLSLAGSLWILWLWAGRLAAADRLGWFLATSLAYLTIPTVALMGGIAFQDHLLLVFVLAASYAFYVFATGFEAGTPRWRWLYAAAGLLGLALLTKYNAVFLAIGFALAILFRPKLRPLFLKGHLWAALLLAAALQTPVIWWNLTEGLASFRFHLVDRPSTAPGRLNWRGLLSFVLTTLVFMSPVLFLSLVRLPWVIRRAAPDTRRVIGLSGAVFAASSLGWAAISLVMTVFFHWNIVAYAALAPIALLLLGRQIGLLLHVTFGLFFITAATLNYTMLPQGLFGLKDPGAPANYGWPEIAAVVTELEASHPGAFLAATRYTYAAQLGFQLRRSDVMAFNPLRSENDYWWDADAHKGADALIIADRAFKIANAEAHFTAVEKLATVEALVPSAQKAWEFEIWLGHNYDGSTP